jgi:signal transduction histidine kinase
MPSGRGAVPVAAAVVVSAALFCLRPLGLAGEVSNSPAGIALLCVSFLICYALGYQDGVPAGLLGVVLLMAALEVVNGTFSPIGPMITIGPWAAGRVVRSRRRLADQLKARNDQLLAQREAYAAEAVRYERSRIAADLHDIVGHALSLMVIQAGAGQRAARAGRAGDGAGDAEQGARAALEIVAEAARQAQADVGLLAGLLSDDRPGAPAQPAPAQPAPAGLDLAAGLVRQVQAAGIEVTYRVLSEGAGAHLDAASAEIVSRVVTEALTNAVKHAPGAPITVEIQAGATGITVTVENEAAVRAGDGIALAGGGYGLTGMRDRVLAAGGQFGSGRTGNGGWRVHASLP